MVRERLKDTCPRCSAKEGRPVIAFNTLCKDCFAADYPGQKIWDSEQIIGEGNFEGEDSRSYQALVDLTDRKACIIPNWWDYTFCFWDAEWASDDETEWTGTVEELVKMALEDADFRFAGRKAKPEDIDWPALKGMYGEVLKWAEQNGF